MGNSRAFVRVGDEGARVTVGREADSSAPTAPRQAPAPELIADRDVPPRVNRARRAALTPAFALGGDLSTGALEVLATVPAWWGRRAAAAGLGKTEQRVFDALAAAPPVS